MRRCCLMRLQTHAAAVRRNYSLYYPRLPRQPPAHLAEEVSRSSSVRAWTLMRSRSKCYSDSTWPSLGQSMRTWPKEFCAAKPRVVPTHAV